MSINFNDPMNDEAKAKLKELFEDELIASDDKTALQPVTLDTHNVGEIKELRDGTKYRTTSRGWRKIND